MALILPFRGPAKRLSPQNAVRSRRETLDAIGQSDSSLGQLLAYWHELKGAGSLPPRRADFDILELGRRKLMGWSHVIDVSTADPRGFSFRLFGSNCDALFQRDFSKVSLNDVPCQLYAQAIMADYNTVKLTGTPSYHKVTARLNWRRTSYTRLVLPLADDQGRTTQLLVSVNRRPLPELEAALP